MKKMFIFIALALLAPSVRADEPLPPGLPGVNADAAPAGESSQLQRPDAARILSDLSAELRLSSKQEERITEAVNKKGKDFDKLLKEYDNASAEEKKWRYKVNELKHGMDGINKSIPDLIRDFLDDDQRQNFDSMLANMRKSKEPAVTQEAAPAEPAVDTQKPVKKRRLIKKRKPRPGTEPAAEPSAAPDAAAPGVVAPEDEPGLTMVDKDTSSGAAAAPKKKKRVLRKKAHAPAADIGAGEPAGAQPTGKDAPVEGDAGSYP
jgi:hypothetical protein